MRVTPFHPEPSARKGPVLCTGNRALDLHCTVPWESRGPKRLPALLARAKGYK